MDQPIDIIACGHLCLDLLPQMEHLPLEALAAPGRLFEVGSMGFSSGGAVSNTGLALHRLGVNVRLMATTGDDEIGYLIRTFVQSRDPAFSELIRVKVGQKSSYTLVLSPARVDRIFFHFAGTNASFNSEDVDYASVARAKILHLGYPPLLHALITKCCAAATLITGRGSFQNSFRFSTWMT
jgi:sugar/nucleoside kinase (ribokinase family)